MKSLKIFLAGVVVIVLATTSCNEEIIDIAPIGSPTEDAYFQNEAEMNSAVLGIYSKMSFFYAWYGGGHIHNVWLLPSDDLTNPGGKATEIFGSLNSGNGDLNRFYQWNYQMLARANTVIEKITENGSFAYDENSDMDDYHMGEALFLRAYNFYLLWNTYGTAPLSASRIKTLADADLPNSKDTELLDQAILDLREASSLLPPSWDSANLGRVTSNSANGLLAKILVFRGTVNNTPADFTEAIIAVDRMSGVSLTDHFNDNFVLTGENGQESLFEYQANNQALITNPWVPGGVDDFSVIGELDAFWGFYNNMGSNGANQAFQATASLIGSYEVGDPRIQYTLNPTASPHNMIKFTYNWWGNGNGVSNANWAGMSINNPRILRYADVLLIKAEAIVRSGGDADAAIGIVNQIRKRARESTNDGSVATIPADFALGQNSTAVLEHVFNERRLELAGEEGHRWYDLRRRHLAGEIDLSTWDFSSVRSDFSFEAHHINFPLPGSEVIQNPNMDQNKDY